MGDLFETTAEIYDYDIGFNRGLRDLLFYSLQCADRAEPVVECGCGTGRLTIPLAHMGYQLWALDSSPAMLGQLNQRASDSGLSGRIRSLLATMQELGGLFESHSSSAVIVPYSAIMYLLELDDLDRFFESAATVLAPRGKLAFDWFLRDETHEQRFSELTYEYTRGLGRSTTAVLGVGWDSFARYKCIERTANPSVNLIHKHYRFYAGGVEVGRRETTDRLRLHTIDEIERASRKVGFVHSFSAGFLGGLSSGFGELAYVGEIR